MKTILFLFCLPLALHAAPMGSINDDVLGNHPASGNAAIQAQIDALQTDIDQKRRTMVHEGNGTHGAYQDIIDAEVKQIYALQKQMAK